MAKVYNTKGTYRQKAVIKNLLENPRKPIGRAMREAGYSPNTAVDPSNLTNSKTWEQLMEDHFPDTKLSKVIDEGLEAKKGKYPDHFIRHKFTETALKLRNKFPAEKHQIEGGANPIQVNLQWNEVIKQAYAKRSNSS